jgi:hypothetical protein
MRAFLIGLLVIVVLIAGGLWYASTPDIPRATLEAKYDAPAAEFVTLGDGTRAHYRGRGAAHPPGLIMLHGSNTCIRTGVPGSK